MCPLPAADRDDAPRLLDERFRQIRCLQKFVAVHPSVHNLFNQERHLSSRNLFKLNRAAALAE